MSGNKGLSLLVNAILDFGCSIKKMGIEFWMVFNASAIM